MIWGGSLILLALAGNSEASARPDLKYLSNILLYFLTYLAALSRSKNYFISFLSRSISFLSFSLS